MSLANYLVYLYKLQNKYKHYELSKNRQIETFILKISLK